jgi:hypothetical protein
MIEKIRIKGLGRVKGWISRSESHQVDDSSSVLQIAKLVHGSRNTAPNFATRTLVSLHWDLQWGGHASLCELRCACLGRYGKTALCDAIFCRAGSACLIN